MANLEVTGITIRPFSAGDDKLKAFASIIINNAFIIKDLKIIEGNNGRFVAMPSRRGKDGVFRDIAHPLNQDTRDYIERIVLEAYEKQAARGFADADRTLDGLSDSLDDYNHREQGYGH